MGLTERNDSPGGDYRFPPSRDDEKWGKLMSSRAKPHLFGKRKAGMAGALTLPRSSGRGSVRPLFVALIFAGSFLLFLTQPMVARMALPRLGGAPAVWNSAMLVYQALLLAGYLYAHLLGRLAPIRQALVHLAVLAVAALWLPLGLTAWQPDPRASPVLWVPLFLLASIGPLFFAISAQAPLMQRWFLASAPDANPYPLYAASNLGSFAGLLAYPLLVEPTTGMSRQSLIWSGAYGGIVLLVAAAATTWRRGRTTAAVAMPAASIAPPSALRWLTWVALAAVPSGLMLSTTAHLTTDIVAMPLLWVLPLGVYLLSFSVAFATDRRAAARIGRLAAPLILVSGGLTFLLSASVAMLAALLGLVMLFAVAVALHARMYELRPDARHLTGFYLASSVGGVLGGIFCALLAPLLFDWTWEHPLLILASTLLLPARATASVWRHPRVRRWAVPLAFALSLLASGFAVPALPGAARIGCGLAVALLAAGAIGERRLFPPLLALMMLACGGWIALGLSLVGDARSRSYFGVYTVSDGPDHSRVLLHGTTLHGLQLLGRGRERVATSYYAPGGGIGQAMRAVPALFGPRARIGVVGLGAGTLACFARAGQDWRFYEIDPEIERIARDPAKFSFLSRCAPSAPVVIGDARLMLAREGDRRFDLLVVDAFSSDSVPIHMLTREAFAIYRRRIGERGLLLLNITNHWMDLEPAISALARADGWAAARCAYRPDAAALALGAQRSVWVALTPAPMLPDIARGGCPWRPLRPTARDTWTDDFASVLPLLRPGGSK